MKKKQKIKDENFNYFKEKHSEIAAAYDRFGQLVHEQGGPLDAKTRWLIKVAVSAASQYDFALHTHIEKALAAGCSHEEIEHSILLVAPTAGFPKAMGALMVFREMD